METVQIRDPNTGNVHAVPRHQAYNAIRGGGELVETRGDKAVRYGKDVGVGLAKMGHGILNSPHNLVKALEDQAEKQGALKNRISQYIPTQDPLDTDRFTLTPQDELIQNLIQQLPAFLMPELKMGKAGKALTSIPKIGKYLSKGKVLGKAAQTAIPVGAFEATQSEGSPFETGGKATAATLPFAALAQTASMSNPYVRLAGKATMGGLGALAGHEIGEQAGLGGIPSTVLSAILGTLGASGGRAQSKARRDMLKGVDGSGYQENLEASRRLGLPYITPAEASKNPFLAALQGHLGRTSEGAELLHNRGQARLEGEQKSINNLLESVYSPSKTEGEINRLYSEAAPIEVSSSKIEGLKDNKVFQRAERMVKNKPAYQESLKNTNVNSIEYLDHLKQALDDMIEKAPNKEGRIITKTKNQLVSAMDEASPSYQQGRQLSELQFARQDLEKIFNKKPMSGLTMYNGLLNNKQAFDKMMHSLRNVPEAQSQLRDMKKIFGDLIPTPTVRTAAHLAKTSMDKERSDTQGIMNKFKELMTGNKYDKAAINLITNPKWEDELKKISELTDNEMKAKLMINLMGRAAASSVGFQSQKTRE